MTKQLWNKFDKKALVTLPRVLFEGRIFVIQTENEARKAVQYLLSQPLLGFDTETRPTFRPGAMHPVALLQVATTDTCCSKLVTRSSSLELFFDAMIIASRQAMSAFQRPCRLQYS